MNKQTGKVLDGLKTAMEAELTGHQFYKAASKNTKDPKGKETFSRMAEEEMGHFNDLRHQYQSILETGEYDFSMPIGYRVTRASVSDTPQLLPLVGDLREKHPQIYEDIENLSGDKGYDSEDNCRQLYDEHGIKPLIDIRRMWRDKETKLLDPERSDNIVYDEVGAIYCVCPVTGEQRQMAYGGFERDRMTLKYVCPIKAYGLRCKGSDQCEHAM